MINKILISIAILTILTGYAWMEYSWADRVLSNYKGEWIVVSKQDLEWKLIKPWTWFKVPVGKILIVEKGVYGKLDSGLFYAHTILFSRTGTSNRELNLIDPKKRKYTSCESLEQFYSLNKEKMKELKWLDYHKPSPINDLVIFLEQKLKPYFMIGPFGECDITNYVASGNYLIAEGEGQRVYVLKNKKPYILNDSDMKPLTKSINKWLNEKGFNAVKSHDILLDSVSYQRTEMLNKIADIYQIKFKLQKDKRDTVLNLDFRIAAPRGAGQHAISTEIIGAN